MPDISKFLRELFDFPFLETAALGLFYLIVDWIRKRIRYRQLHKVWDKIIGGHPEINVVFPSFNVKEFQVEIVGKTSHIPSNVHLLPLAESLGISSLVQLFELIYRKKKIVLHPSENFTLLTSSFISIGGPSINRISNMLLNVQQVDKHFKIIYPDHYAQDQFNLRDYVAREKNGAIENDFGFIIIAENPFNPKETVCILCGIWAHGTNAAIQATTKLLVEQRASDSVKKFVKKLSAKGEILVVVESKVHGFTTGVPNIVMVRDIAKGSVQKEKTFSDSKPELALKAKRKRL